MSTVILSAPEVGIACVGCTLTVKVATVSAVVGKTDMVTTRSKREYPDLQVERLYQLNYSAGR